MRAGGYSSNTPSDEAYSPLKAAEQPNEICESALTLMEVLGTIFIYIKYSYDNTVEVRVSYSSNCTTSISGSP